MSENVIFCYSGTGNCLDMAKTIARELGDTDIILMRREPAVTDVRDAKRAGFVFPCYGGGLPGGVEESLRKIQVASRLIRSASASMRAIWAPACTSSTASSPCATGRPCRTSARASGCCRTT